MRSLVLNFRDKYGCKIVLIPRCVVCFTVILAESGEINHFHIFPNQQSVGNEIVGELTNFFRVGSKHQRPTENRSLSDHLPIVCKVLAYISVVRGITCGNRSYHIIPQPIAEGLSIYSAKSSYLLFRRFQGLGPVPWIDGRYHFGVFIGLIHVPVVVHCADLGEINICVCACATNPLEVFDILYHAL